MKKITKIEVIRPGSNPDVDTDFNTSIRDEVLAHVSETYGHENVANIITYNSLAAKSAFKTMCTIYQIPFLAANKIASLVPPPIEGVDCTIDDIFNPRSDRYAEGAEFRSATSGPTWAKIIDGARAIEGRYRSTGLHPCGVVISSRPLSEVLPLQVRQEDGRVITQWTYPECESVGLIKFDFLGLDTVDLIQHSVEYIMKDGKVPPNMVDLIHGEMNDKKTFAMLAKGETVGVFQLGSQIVQDFLKTMQPTEFEDIAASTALMRPGPMGMNSHTRYASRKNNREVVAALHPDFANSPLTKILGKTYGLCVYQEQVLKIANEIAGMTLQEGDELRSAMGKKKVAKMLEMKPKFFDGSKKNGYSEEAVNKLWDTISEFAKYGFNRCAHGDTLVYDQYNRKLRLRDLHKRWAKGERDFELLAMWEDGSIRPHKVRDVIYTGRKSVYEIKTAAGRSIKITKDHRLLTTHGYGTIEDGLSLGVELMVDEADRSFGLTEAERIARAARMTSYNQSIAGRQKARVTMKATQATITYEERCLHQQQIQKLNPERTKPWQIAALASLEQLRKDPVWVRNFAESLRQRDKEGYRGYGKVTRISDGRFCDSIVEAAAAEYFLARGIEFELHKIIPNPTTGLCRISDFYAQGVYFEMDGLQRGEAWFKENKYGDVPFVYLTPYNFVDKIEEVLVTSHAHNGDPIISITKISKDKQKVYDVEMELEGPSNFIANGIVSHNSHSVAYAMNAYQAAFLKANYPVEFMAALVSQNVGNKEKILAYLQEARRMNLKVGSVSINESDINVAPDYTHASKYDIVYGVSGVNSVSKDMAAIIISERDKNGLYKSVQDLINRCSPLGVTNRKIYENLALAGAFDVFGYSRKGVVEALPSMLGEAKTKTNFGTSLFDLFGEDDDVPEMDLTSKPEYPFVEKLQKEASVIGLYLTDHPLSRVGTGLSAAGVVPISKVMASTSTTTAVIVGSITDIEKKIRKQGGKTVTITVDDGKGYITANIAKDIVKGIDKAVAQDRIKRFYTTGETEVAKEIRDAALDDTFEAIPDLEKNAVYLMSITYRPPIGDGQYGARINAIKPLPLSDEGILPVRMRVPLKLASDENTLKARIIKFAEAVALKHPGDYPLYAAIITDEASQVVINENSYYESLIAQIQAMKPANTKKSTYTEATLFTDGKVEEEADNDTKKKFVRPLPQAMYPPTAYRKATEDEISERVVYFDTGVKVAKNTHVEEVLSNKFGAERVDFGVFNTSMALEGR